MRKDEKCDVTISKITKILESIGLTYEVRRNINNNRLLHSITIEIVELQGITSNGKGVSYEAALASALAEMMERIQARLNIKFWYALKNIPEKSISSEYISTENLELNYFNRFKHTRFSRYRLNYKCLFTDKEISLPNRLINLLCSSNGLCAGNTKFEAICQGICEIFERYTRKKIARRDIAIKEIDISVITKSITYDIILSLKEYGYNFKLLDLSEDNFPVVGLLCINKSKDKYFFTVGSDIDFEIAVERCITEMFQGREIKNFDEEMQFIDYSSENFESDEWDKTKEGAYSSFIFNYIMNKGCNPIDIFYKHDKIYTAPDIFYPVKTNAEAFTILQEILIKNKLDVYYYDYSYLGFPTYRVYIPTITEIFIIDEEEVDFFDNIKTNLYNIINISNICENTMAGFIDTLIQISNNYIYRISPFKDVIFRFIGNREFDINYLYLDLLIAILLIKTKQLDKAYYHYSRLCDEMSILSIHSNNGLLKSLFSVLKCVVEEGYSLKKSLDKLVYLHNIVELGYIEKMIISENIENIVYLPSCPECEICSYCDQCQYDIWSDINNKLTKKQIEFYSRREK